jgi:hypothetical protein
LSAKRKFSTLVEELKEIAFPKPLVSDAGNIMVPAHSSVRSPVLLLMGGGMGAGKSTVVKEILKRYILIFDTHLARIGSPQRSWLH